MISDEDAKDILGEMQSRAASCRSLAQVAEPFPTENARLTSAANAWGYATDLVKQWIERVNDAPTTDVATVSRSPG